VNTHHSLAVRVHWAVVIWLASAVSVECRLKDRWRSTGYLWWSVLAVL